MLDHPREVHITGGTFNAYGGGHTAFKELQNHTAPGAFHNSGERFDPPKCHPNTRVTVLQRLMDWIMARSDASALIMWIHGAAGAGKSAIAQTFAERCYELGLLLGSFFFSRSDSKRNHAGHLIPTLAYQIALFIPEYRTSLESIIDHDPLIFSKSFETQVMVLIVEPLRALAISGFFADPATAPRLIIIDGLDECQDIKVQSTIINLIVKILQTQSVPLVFLISSRPETAIFHKFNSTALSEIHLRLPLDDESHTYEDIRRFLKESFADIKADHPKKYFIPPSWPPSDAIETLIQKASGQFIFAAVAMKYVSSIDDLPTRGLETILGLRPPRREMPFAELDALYLHILESARYRDEALRILASVILRPGFIDIEFAEFSLHLEAGEIEVFLADLAALVSVSPPYIRIKHASFSDFLFDPARSRLFYLEPGHYHTKYAIEWLQSFMSSQFQEYASILARRDPFDHSAYEFFRFNRIRGASTHFSLARPTPEFRDAVLQCSLHDILNDSNPRYLTREGDYLATIGSISFLLEYLTVIRNLKFDDIKQIFVGFLSHLDKILIKHFDMLSDNTITYTFLDSALLLSKRKLGDEDIFSAPESFYREKQEPLSQFTPSNDAIDILFDFIQNPQRSRHHSMNSEKYTSAAVSCLQYLFNHEIFSVSSWLTLTGADMQTRRNLPWRWRQLSALNCHFRARHRIAGIHSSRISFSITSGTMYASTFKLLPDARDPIPYPNFCLQHRSNKERNKLYIDLLRCFPIILRKAAKSDDVLKLVNRAFPDTSPRFSREKRAARRAIDAYVARTFGNVDVNEKVQRSASGPP